jgi:RHS repeat-associated protein
MNWTLNGNAVGDLEYAGACPERSRRNADGRVIQKTGSLASSQLPSPVSGNTFNADNEMTAFNGTTLTGACPERSRRNADGNLTSDGTNSYLWDARGHLSTLAGTNVAAYQYDAFGRRVQNTLNGVMTQYLYDGLNPVEEFDGSSPPNVTATMLTGLGIDECFQRTDSSGTLSYLSDMVGSTLALADSSGALDTAYTYDPFGNVTVNGADTNPYQFTGRENDGTGLYYYRARYYSPTFQRFIAQDPIGFAGGDPNIYAYVGNDAVNLLDPEGLWTAAVGWTFGGGAGWGGGSFTIGFAIDGNGNIALTIGGGAGVGLGADAYSGLSTSFSTAPCVTDLGGPFFNQSFGGGLGLDLNVDTFEGKAASNGAPIFGWGLTTGAGLGLGGSVGGSGTVVVPLGRL